ncbi:MAG: outer membrane beta-barrel protein [Myxococcota bacterium]|nr:outer membrane beta-barrel protein [Myxococcota bacterium]
MMIITLLAGAALAGSADGIDHELSVELGSMYTSDDTWRALSDSESVTALGIRAGYSISPSVAVVASWHRGVHDSRLSISSNDTVNMDFTIHQLAVGPKVDYPIFHWLRPYATVQGVGVLGRLQLDEDSQDDDNDLLRFSDTSFGGFAALGAEFVPGSESRRLHLATHLEMGYGKVFAMTFEDEDAGNTAIEIGDLDMQGFTINAGVGVRF